MAQVYAVVNSFGNALFLGHMLSITTSRNNEFVLKVMTLVKRKLLIFSCFSNIFTGEIFMLLSFLRHIELLDLQNIHVRFMSCMVAYHELHLN